MADIVAVLAVPTEDDHGGLLAHGRCGSEPSCVHCPIGGQWCEEFSDDGDEQWSPHTGAYALPLWWDGTLVPEGLDRALRCGGTDDCDTFDRHPSMDQVLELACWLVARGLASRVVRLDRVGGRLVEVSDG